VDEGAGLKSGIIKEEAGLGRTRVGTVELVVEQLKHTKGEET